MKKIICFLFLFLSILNLSGCATFQAIKEEYRRNKVYPYEDDFKEESVNISRGIEKDFSRPFLAIENFFAGDDKKYEDKFKD